MNTIINTITSHPYWFFDLLIKVIKVIALLGGSCAAIYGLIQLRHSITRARHQYLNDFHKEFLASEILDKRKQIAEFWKKRITRESEKCILVNLREIGNMINEKEINHYCEKGGQELTLYIDRKEKEIIAYIERNAGIRFNIPSDEEISQIDEKIIKTTEEILNNYEHLGKLYKGGAVKKKDIKLFFYTMLADTFVLTLPFILNRRRNQSKLHYAHKMQGLLKLVPYLSGDVTKV